MLWRSSLFERRRILAALAFLLSCLLMPAADATTLPDAPEVTVCGAMRERLAFWAWSRTAGAADPTRVDGLQAAEPVQHVTRDGRTLRGYRLRVPAGERRLVVLVAGGNAMLADQILPELAVLAEAGLELYVFDYRGYGASEGRPRLLAIIGDHVELAQRIAAESGAPIAFYGISMGGIVLANALSRLSADMQPDRFVIDGSPARISGHGCPDLFDTIANLPANRRMLSFVGGERDNVVPLRESAELIEAIRDGGGRVEIRADFAHPFMDSAPATRRARLELVRDLLVNGL